jgi:hypothetical protein
VVISAPQREVPVNPYDSRSHRHRDNGPFTGTEPEDYERYAEQGHDTDTLTLFVTKEPTNEPAQADINTVPTPPVDKDPSALSDHIKSATSSDDTIKAILKVLRTGQRCISDRLIYWKRMRIELGDCRGTDGMLYVRNKVYVPEVDNLRTRVLDQVHRFLCGRHGVKRESSTKASR